MAVIGARPATGIWFPGRRARPRPRPVARTRPRAGAGRRRREIGSVSGFLVGIAAAAGLALFYLSQSSHVAATGYQIDALQGTVDQLMREQQQLVLQIGEARSPSQIEARARSELKLVPLAQEAVRFAPGSRATGASTITGRSAAAQQSPAPNAPRH